MKRTALTVGAVCGILLTLVVPTFAAAAKLDSINQGEINFYTVVEAARQRGEVAIGYRGAGHTTDKARAYGVVVNPNKAEPVTFGPDDMIIVIAEG